MQHKTHTDSPSKNKGQQSSNQGNSTQRAATDNTKAKGGTQGQQNKSAGADSNQRNDRTQSK